jgi:general secretion pathway protein K
MRRRHHQAGVAAIVAILIVALAASSATYLIAKYSLALRHVENMADRAQADQLARTAVHWVAGILNQDKDRAADHHFEIWALPLPPIPAEDATVEGRIVDEQAKFNLNNLVQQGKVSALDMAALERLFLLLKLDPRLIDTLIDWIDEDEEPTQPQGAESVVYLSLDPPYRAANTKLTDVGELARIKGFDREIIEQLLPYVTALPRVTKVNINTASAELLQAIAPSLSTEGALELVAKRTKEKRSLTRNDLLDKVPKQSQDAVESMIDVRTDYFSASGMVRRGRVVAGYRALFERESGKQTTVVALTEEPI